jgi:integrase
VTLQTFFDEVYRPLRLRGRSPGTSRLYRATLVAFGKWLGRAPVLADLDELVLSRYLEQRCQRVSPYTAEKERTQLVALARMAWERRLLEHMPSVPPSPLPDRVPTAWSVDDMARLMDAAGRYHVTRAGVVLSELFPALLATLWETGERIGAVMDTAVEDYRRPHLVVRAAHRKGARRDRCYRLTPATCDRLEAVTRADHPLLFPWPYTRTYLWRHMRGIVQSAGLGNARRLRFHQIRRSAASHLAAAGGDPVRFLDHANPSTTRRWYLDPRLSERGTPPCDLLPAIGPTHAKVGA